MVDSQYKIRVLLAVATESVADRIKSSVQDADDIEIVGVITSVDELVLSIARLFPKVIILQVEIDDNWSDYVKQINKLIPEPAKPSPSTPESLLEYEKLFYRWNFESSKVITIATNESAEQLQQAMLAGAQFHLPPTATDEQILNTIRTVGNQYLSLRSTWREPLTYTDEAVDMTEIQPEYRPDIIRVLLGVALESLADDIKAMVQGENDIEIVGVITSAEDVLPKVKEVMPNVVCFHTLLHERWDEYVKQIYRYAGEALAESIPSPDFRNPIAYKKWRLACIQRHMRDISIVLMLPDNSVEPMQRGLIAGAKFLMPTYLPKEKFLKIIRMVATYYTTVRDGYN